MQFRHILEMAPQRLIRILFQREILERTETSGIPIYPKL